MIGTRILHYSIIEQLGEGGMGEVYLAEDEKLHRRVALKFLHRTIRENADARDRLIREARSASQLSHPNIVSIHAIEETAEHVFIAMEYVEGESLRDRIQRGAVSVDDALDISNQVLAGLSAAHARGLVHRDIKSDNIIIADDGRARVLDFGLARPAGSPSVTRYGSSVGTPAYMSPEQVQGLDLDGRSDLFSFGCVLYEMLSSELAFKGAHESAVTYAIVNEEPAPLSSEVAKAKPGLDQVVARLLSKSPEKRYADAAEASAEIARVRSGHAPAARAASRSARRPIPILPIILVVAIAALGWFYVRQKTAAPEVVAYDDDRHMLVVLPFENLGPADHEYFADGITEEITTHLARMSGLGVISRTSAMRYKGSGLSLREIGQELNVDYVLEGSVRWDASGAEKRLRITTQLIRIDDDTHLWAETFDRVLEQVFELQTEIAGNVATALDVTLLEPERALMARAPTENMDAYDLFLKGRDLWDRQRTMGDREKAIETIERAVELDSTFAAAQAMLARVYSNDFFNGRDEGGMRLQQAFNAATAALVNGPGQPYGHLAMGYYHYYGSRDYDSALREFARARALEPNNSDLYEAMAYVLRRQGRWDEATDAMERSAELDPHSREKISNVVELQIRNRRYQEAGKTLKHALDVNPDWAEMLALQALLEMTSTGDMDLARELLETAYERTQIPAFQNFLMQLDIMARDYDRALTREPPPAEDDGDMDAYHFNRGIAMHYAGRSEEATKEFQKLLLEQGEFDEQTSNAARVSFRGMTLAATGDCDAGVELVNRAVTMMPVERDFLTAIDNISNRSIVYLICGQQDKAMDDIEFLLSVPSYATPAMLRAHPVYDVLKGNPRFDRMLTAKPQP